MLQKMKIRARQVGPWGMNAYVLVCERTGKSVLIDPGADPKILLEILRDTDPVAILLTHSHADHLGALDVMRGKLRVNLLAHPGEHAQPVSADRWLNHGEQVEVGECAVNVHYAPGHIGDQICFEIEGQNEVIVGDTIFEGGPGKTWSAEGFRITLETLQNIILPWPDETRFYPGHGPDFHLGDIRAQIEAFLKKDHGLFFSDATWDM